MNRSDFLVAFQDLLQRDDAVTLDMQLRDLEEWDSLSIMAAIAYFDKKFGIALTFERFKHVKTVADVVALASSRIS